jgi:hypothetical protein
MLPGAGDVTLKSIIESASAATGTNSNTRVLIKTSLLYIISVPV